MTQRFFRILVASALFIALSHGCSSIPDKNASTAASSPSAFDSKFNRLEIGFEKSKVTEILGDPSLREARGETETWHYGADGEGRLVQFDKGKVISFGRDTRMTPETSSSGDVGPAKAGLGLIGESCKENKDCKDKNCHFKICAGFNNCQLREGMVCATDENCCTGHCNFGVCRTR